ncbi:hypothetical protein H4R20_004670, partial [Coemansia guatemalensis]
MDKQHNYLYYDRPADDTRSAADDFGGRTHAYLPANGGDNPFADQSNSDMMHQRSALFSGIRQAPMNIGDDSKGMQMDAYAQKEEAKGPTGGTGGEGNVDKGGHEHVEDLDTTMSRRLWVGATWALTFWIPSPFLGI